MKLPWKTSSMLAYLNALPYNLFSQSYPSFIIQSENTGSRILHFWVVECWLNTVFVNIALLSNGIVGNLISIPDLYDCPHVMLANAIPILF